MSCHTLWNGLSFLPWAPPPDMPHVLLQEVLDLLHAFAGGQVSPLFRFMLQATLYLSLDPYKSSARRLRLLQKEYGAAFETELCETATSLQLEVNKCFYNELFAAEGKPQLTRTTCCRQDIVW